MCMIMSMCRYVTIYMCIHSHKFLQRANLSVASLTISSDRITSVDFTKPFLELGTSILCTMIN